MQHLYCRLTSIARVTMAQDADSRERPCQITDPRLLCVIMRLLVRDAAPGERADALMVGRHIAALQVIATTCRRWIPLDSSPACIRTLIALKGKLLCWIGDERIIVSVLKKMRNPDLVHPNPCIPTMRKIIWDA